jgi:hypothetical protein
MVRAEVYYFHLDKDLRQGLPGRTIKRIEMDVWPYTKEAKKELEQKSRDGFNGAATNIEFIRTKLSPALSELCEYGKPLDENSVETGIAINFGVLRDPAPQVGPYKKVFIRYNGVDLRLHKSEIGENGMPEEKDLGILNERNIQNLCRGFLCKEVRGSMLTFGKMSKRDITLTLISYLRAMVAQHPFSAEIEPINPGRINKVRRVLLRNQFSVDKITSSR